VYASPPKRLGLRFAQVIPLRADLRSEHSHFLIAAQAVPIQPEPYAKSAQEIVEILQKRLDNTM
jgi:hypothetical protein